MTNLSRESEPSPPLLEELTYEQALSELEEIVAALESGDHALESSLALFERGQALARHCAQLLEKAELKITMLSGDNLVEFPQE